MIATTLSAFFVIAAYAGDAKVAVHVPALYVRSDSFKVRLDIEAPADGAKLEGWQLTPAGFQVDGQPLLAHGDEPAVELKGGEIKTVEFDLGPSLQAAADFELAWGTLPAQKVRVLEPAPKDLNFQDEASVPAAELGDYWVLLRTNRGDVLAEFWPDAAPNHVRNFLDLSATGFYDELTFHRVIPGFMIQGGDPSGSGTGSGPRRLKLEPSDRKHTRGVLSMARSSDPNSASCQFFVMHAPASHLDHQYSAFGQVVLGMDAVDRIVNTPRDPNDRPKDPQVIERAIVVKAPADPASWREAAK